MKKNIDFNFTKTNWIILSISVFLIIIGYIVMGWGIEPNSYEFHPNIYSFKNITLAPILLLIGYMMVIFSIFYKNKSEA